MTHTSIAENSAVLIAVGPVLLGLFAFAWTTLRRSWRLFGAGFAAFALPFLLFITSAALATAEVSADVMVFILGCASLGSCTVGYGLAVLLIWRNREKTNGMDFK